MNSNKNVLSYVFFGAVGLVSLVNWYLENKDQVNDLLTKLSDRWTREQSNMEQLQESLEGIFPSDGQETPSTGESNIAGSVNPEGPTANSPPGGTEINI